MILVAAPFVIVMLGMYVALMCDLPKAPWMARGEMGVEAVESAMITGHEQYDGDLELRIGPVRGRRTRRVGSESAEGSGRGCLPVVDGPAVRGRRRADSPGGRTCRSCSAGPAPPTSLMEGRSPVADAVRGRPATDR
jgi:hypothetical protein